MKSTILRNLCLAILGVLALGCTAWADTLEMRDGRLIQGKFVGGSELHIRFQVNGREEVFDTKDVLNISFNETMDNPAVANEPPRDEPRDESGNRREAHSIESRERRDERGGEFIVPVGTTLLVRMIDGVDSNTNRVGDIFHASLADALVVGDTIVAPKGADVIGRLTNAKSAGQIQGRSELRLELTGVSVNGRMRTIVTGEYDVAGKSRGKQSAERIGGGAAIGAVIGAIAGGGEGAAIGAGVGAGAGTGVQIFTHGDQVKVPSETLLEFKLDQPLTIVPAGSNER